MGGVSSILVAADGSRRIFAGASQRGLASAATQAKTTKRDVINRDKLVVWR